MITYSAVLIANYFVRRGNENPKTNDVTPMKALKLTYIAHGLYLAVTDKPLLGEKVYAWRYGPVIESVYHAFKSFGKDPITTPATVGEQEIIADETVKIVLDLVWRIYEKTSGLQLSTLTHQPDTPWYDAWHKETPDGVISDDSIKQYYKKKYPLD